MGSWFFLVILGILVAVGVVYRERVARWAEKASVFLREVRVEMQKVVWPSKEDVKGATFVVLVSVAILTVAIGLEDKILSEILKIILLLAARS